jgi:hypothetical protein
MMLKGMPPRVRNGQCSKCGAEARMKGQRYCRDCHATYQRGFRAKRKEELLMLREVVKNMVIDK